MTTIVYADILFIINFCVDYICFYFVSKILNLRVRFIRIIAASSLGAIYGIVIVIYNSLLVHLIMLVIINVVCFGIRLKIIYKIVFLYFLFSSTLGGLVTFLYNYFENNIIIYICILVSSIITYLYYASLKVSCDDRMLEVKIVDNNISYCADGFVDTGNLLVDPYNGNYVVLVKKRIFGNGFDIEEKRSFRCIPVNYRNEKFLKAYIPDKIILKYKNKEIEFKASIAVDETEGDFNGSLILIPKRLIGDIL